MLRSSRAPTTPPTRLLRFSPSLRSLVNSPRPRRAEGRGYGRARARASEHVELGRRHCFERTRILRRGELAPLEKTRGGRSSCCEVVARATKNEGDARCRSKLSHAFEHSTPRRARAGEMSANL